jgi:hypothetical protein
MDRDCHANDALNPRSLFGLMENPKAPHKDADPTWVETQLHEARKNYSCNSKMASDMSQTLLKSQKRRAAPSRSAQRSKPTTNFASVFAFSFCSSIPLLSARRFTSSYLGD